MNRKLNVAMGVMVTVACSALVSPAHAAPVSWITEANSFWDLATNWSPGLPGVDDDVTIAVAGARIVTLRSTGSPFTVNSLMVDGDDALTISSGSLTVNGLVSADNTSGVSSLAKLSQSGGSLGGAGTVTVVGAASLTGGTHTGSGTTVLQGTTALSGFSLDAGRTLRNESTVTLTGGMNLNGTDAAGAGRVENAVGAVFDVRTFNLSMAASSFAGDTGADAAFHNAGTFRKSTTRNYGVDVPFIQLATGTIDVQLGSFTFSGGGTYGGSVTLAAGTSLGFSAGIHTIEAGASVVGQGTFALTGASTVLELLAPTTVNSGFSMGGGTIRGADLTLTGPTSIAIASSLGVMSGAATTTLQGVSSVSGGANNPFGLDAGRVLRNEGTMTITGVLDLNRLDAAGAGRIENATGALIDVKTFNQSIYARDWTAVNALDSGADARIDNAGTFRRSTTGGYGVGVHFVNLAGGTVDIQAGSFNFTGGGTYNGAVTIADNAGLTFGGGLHQLGVGATFTGPGTLTLSGAATVLDVLSPLNIDTTFTMTGGTIRGTDLTLRGPISITISSSLGMMTGAATTTLIGSGTVSGGANNPFGLDAGRVLRNEGTMTITGVLDLNRSSDTGAGGIVNVAGALIDVKTFNQSIYARDWTAVNALDSGADARIDNAGTFRKSTSGTYNVFVPFFNTGTVEVLAGAFNIASFSNGGTVTVAAGTTFRVSGASFVNEGLIAGNGTVVAPGSGLINAGIIGPGNSPGHLTIDGDLILDDDGVVAIELNGLADFDRLTIAGDVTLGGALDIVRLDAYSPVVGDSFIILTFDGRGASTFDRVTLQGFGDGVAFDVAYGVQDVRLTVAAVPEPEAWAMLASGLGILGFAARRCSARRAVM
ncbi:MAG: hypothetical protein KIT73_17515 [Burkholderiales bacterium]|nr:hypothetical protein [Burkholderiales bacterium]